MKSGYKIIWTSHAIAELKDTLEYLKENWTEKEYKRFSKDLDHTLELISKNPHLFPETLKKIGVRKVVIAKYNSLFYWEKNGDLEILSLFSNRQNPDKINL